MYACTPVRERKETSRAKLPTLERPPPPASARHSDDSSRMQTVEQRLPASPPVIVRQVRQLEISIILAIRTWTFAGRARRSLKGLSVNEDFCTGCWLSYVGSAGDSISTENVLGAQTRLSDVSGGRGEIDGKHSGPPMEVG